MTGRITNYGDPKWLHDLAYETNPAKACQYYLLKHLDMTIDELEERAQEWMRKMNSDNAIPIICMPPDYGDAPKTKWLELGK